MRTGRGGRGQAEREERERIRGPVGGGMNGWRWRDKHGNKKKRGDKSLLLFVHKQTRLFLSFLARLLVFTVSFFFFFNFSFMDLSCQPVYALTFPLHTS